MKKIVVMGLTYIFAGLIGYSISWFYCSRFVESEAKSFELQSNMTNVSIAHGELDRQLESIRLATKKYDTKMDSTDLLAHLCAGADTWLALAKRRAELATSASQQSASDFDQARLRKRAEQVLSSPQAGGKCPIAAGVN